MTAAAFSDRFSQAATAARPHVERESAAMARGTHSLVVGYLTWLLGFTGSHRFYYGKPLTGTLWLCTGGLFLIGWLVDLFLIPVMHRSAERRYVAGPVDYNFAWILLTFFGVFGVHRMYLGKWVSGLVALLVTSGAVVFWPLAVFPAALMLWDFLTLNEQVTELNARRLT